MAMTDIFVRPYDGKMFLCDIWCTGYKKLQNDRFII